MSTAQAAREAAELKAAAQRCIAAANSVPERAARTLIALANSYTRRANIMGGVLA